MMMDLSSDLDTFRPVDGRPGHLTLPCSSASVKGRGHIQRSSGQVRTDVEKGVMGRWGRVDLAIGNRAVVGYDRLSLPKDATPASQPASLRVWAGHGARWPRVGHQGGLAAR